MVLWWLTSKLKHWPLYRRHWFQTKWVNAKSISGRISHINLPLLCLCILLNAISRWLAPKQLPCNSITSHVKLWNGFWPKRWKRYKNKAFLSWPTYFKPKCYWLCIHFIGVLLKHKSTMFRRLVCIISCNILTLMFPFFKSVHVFSYCSKFV